MGIDELNRSGVIDLSYVQEQMAEERELAKKLRERQAELDLERKNNNKYGKEEAKADIKKGIVANFNDFRKTLAVGIASSVLLVSSSFGAGMAVANQQRTAEPTQEAETMQVSKNLSEKSGAFGDGDRDDGVVLETKFGEVYIPGETLENAYQYYESSKSAQVDTYQIDVSQVDIEQPVAGGAVGTYQYYGAPDVVYTDGSNQKNVDEEIDIQKKGDTSESLVRERVNHTSTDALSDTFELSR